MSRVLTSEQGDRGSIPGQVIPKTQKMVYDNSLLNAHLYKVCIKHKVEQLRKSCSSFWKGSLRVALDNSRQLYLRLVKPCWVISYRNQFTKCDLFIQKYMFKMNINWNHFRYRKSMWHIGQNRLGSNRLRDSDVEPHHLNRFSAIS